MKHWMILFISLFILSSYTSANQVVGQVILRVENRIPTVLDITFSPQAPYPDDILSCIPDIEDEQPKEVRIDYSWERNGVAIENNAAILQDLRADDAITCTATPTDDEGAIGKSFKKTITIQTPTAAAKMTKTLANAFGKDINLAQSTKLEEQGLSAITGYVVYEGIGIGNLLWLLIILLIVSALLLSVLVLRHKRQ
ncbi:MAG: hypothetical protein ABIJ21_00130 [Nanoarchaeota archaeon]